MKNSNYKPTEKELLDLGFKSKDGDHYILEITEDDIYGFKFPCLINYFVEGNLFLMGAAFYFLPDSYEDIKTIIRLFGTNVNKRKLETMK